jgi:MFS transporter, LPLT family, lysophospholipid transporter
MLGLVGLYTAMDKGGMPVVQSATIFGEVVLTAIVALAIYRFKSR